MLLDTWFPPTGWFASRSLATSWWKRFPAGSMPNRQPAADEALFGGVSQTAGIISRRQRRLSQCISVMRVAVAGRRGGAHDLA